MNGPLLLNSIDAPTPAGGGLKIISIGTGADVINFGCGDANSDAKTINIGAHNNVINFFGLTNHVETTNTTIKDANIVLNQDAVGNGTAKGCGINIFDNGSDSAGYMRTDSVNGSTFVFLAPQSPGSQVITMTTSPSADYDLSTVQFVNNLLTNYYTKTLCDSNFGSKADVTTLKSYFINNKLPISNLSISNSATGT